MKNIKKILTSNRFTSFYWRTGMMALAGLITLIANNIVDFGITGEYAVLLGLVLGEISKAINNSVQGK